MICGDGGLFDGAWCQVVEMYFSRHGNRTRGQPMTITCPVHGIQTAHYVCQHIVEGLRVGERVGFHTASGAQPADRRDAWCSSCDRRARANGGHWVGQALDNLGVKAICANCYDNARSSMKGNAESPR